MEQPARIHARPKQSLGQNFLIDDNIARNIVRDLRLHRDDVVLEIGPGYGALTKYLTDRVRRFIAVEIDRRVAEELRRRYDPQQVTILHEDFLETDLGKWSSKYRAEIRIVGNIPYHLTSPILFKIFDAHSCIRDITLTMQREVAQRLVARPATKEYGILSVFSQFYGVPKILFSVSPNCFYPKPKVTSAVIRIDLEKARRYRVDESLFRVVVRTAFGKRRKTLRNNLKFLPFEQKTVERVLSTIGAPIAVRAEELTVEQFVQVTNGIQRCQTG